MTFKPNKGWLSDFEKQIGEALLRDGFVSCNIDDLGSDAKQLFGAMEQDFKKNFSFNDQELASALEKNKSRGDEHYMLFKYYPGSQIKKSEEPLLHFADLPCIQNIMTYVLKDRPILKGMNYWLTVPHVNKDRIRSQLWHRDPGDSNMVKVFLYFNDVDEKSGPTQYIPCSFYGGKNYKTTPKKPFLIGYYPTPKECENMVLDIDPVTLIGKKGTVFFINTHGLHRGGLGEKSREIGELFFTSRASYQTAKYSVVN